MMCVCVGRGGEQKSGSAVGRAVRTTPAVHHVNLLPHKNIDSNTEDLFIVPPR